jgi:flagellar protein FlgJ
MFPINASASPPIAPVPKHAVELTTGQKLESVFLAEMLKSAGVGESPDSFGGGAGEDQFASFLREAHAREMVRAGGLGLAAHFDRAMMKGT